MKKRAEERLKPFLKINEKDLTVSVYRLTPRERGDINHLFDIRKIEILEGIEILEEHDRKKKKEKVELIHKIIKIQSVFVLISKEHKEKNRKKFEESLS